MQTKLDKLDWQVLHELDSDASQSFANIGKKLKVGRDVIHYRVKRLEELGVIKKYISIINYSKLGYLVGALYVKFQHESPELRQEIINYYKTKPEVWWLLDMTPNYDFAFGWFGKNILEMRKIQIEILKKYKKYFKNFKFRIYNHFYHFGRRYLSKQNEVLGSKPISVVDSKTEKITDEIDEKILFVLSENARKPYVEIANELGLSAAQVHYRIKCLKKNGVLLGARPMLDLEKLGYEFFKLDIYLDDYSIYDDALRFCHSLPNVVYSYDVIGGADIELDIEIESYEQFTKLQDLIKSKFGSAISYTEHYQFKKEYKLIYFLQLTQKEKGGN